MSRRKTPEEIEREAELADERAAKIARFQADCSHYNCHPAEWYWSGKIRVMVCDDCDLEEFRDDE